MSSRRRLLRIVAAGLVVPTAAVGCGGGGDDGTLPAVELDRLGGGAAVVLSEIEGPAVINVWATWCAPCRQELPAFQEVSDELDATVAFVGVNDGDTGSAAQAFLDEIGVTFPQYLDPDGAVTEALRITGLPATVLVDADGRVVADHAGALDADELRELVESSFDTP